MKRGLLALTTLLLAPLAVLHAAELVLVAPGIAPAPIIVFKDAPPRTRDAAVTLADYVEKISGARPEVIDGEPKPLAACAIWMASSRSATSSPPCAGNAPTNPSPSTSAAKRSRN
ncbi:MAG: hypothetical protein FJ395_02135 [Verrucomicrobia bacterium]|nr:hypothetical protein [Verrucomicrobiota bacterium]